MLGTLREGIRRKGGSEGGGKELMELQEGQREGVEGLRGWGERGMERVEGERKGGGKLGVGV